MSEIEIEPEVTTWLESLSPSHFDEAREAIERLAIAGHRVRMPLSRPLGEGLFERHAPGARCLSLALGHDDAHAECLCTLRHRAARLPQLRAAHDPVRHRQHGEVLDVPPRVAGAADQPAGGVADRLDPATIVPSGSMTIWGWFTTQRRTNESIQPH